MSDLISRTDAIEAVEQAIFNHDSAIMRITALPSADAVQCTTNREDDLEAIDMAIEALQAEYEDYEHATLVDIKEPLKVSVVRCKDCKHYEDGMVGYCWEVDRGVAEDFFCAYGERREP